MLVLRKTLSKRDTKKKIMAAKSEKVEENRFVFPGDEIRDFSKEKVFFLGPGVLPNKDERCSIQVSKAGKIQWGSNRCWVDSTPKRYIPKRGDLIIGIIAKKIGDNFKVDIGCGEFASLSALAFEGATKKQKPDVQVGDIIYGKLLNAHREMEPELVCVDSYYKAGKMGPLSTEGFLFNTSISLVYRLLDPGNSILSELGKIFPYEIVVGMNGKIWVHGRSPKEVLTVMRFLEAAETYDDKTLLDLIRQSR